MPAASILIKPSSANCNINCKYCFYKCLSSNREEYSKGFMSEETLEQLIVNAIDYADNYAAFAFQGGEPTLAGIDFFRKAVNLQKKHNIKNLTIENTIQTNGILIDEEWARFLAKNHFLVGLSLDGPKKIHDRYRRDVSGNPTFEKVMHTVNLFEQYHVEYNILSVITDESAAKASYLYNFYKRNGFQYIQMIPCMDEHTRVAESQLPRCKQDNVERNVLQAHGVLTQNCNKEDAQDRKTDVGKLPDAGRGAEERYAVSPELYGKFLCEMFDLWYDDFSKGGSMDIRMFSNLAQIAAGYPAEECGMNGHCTCYFVVEGDGSVYPCDFYCMDQWKLGTVKDSFQIMMESRKVKEFIKPSQNVFEKCTGCPHFSLCRGGCRRWRENADGNVPGMNMLCPAYERFFAYAGPRIEKLGQVIINRYGRYTGQ